MKVLMIDNYDSFTFNLVHYLEGLDADVDVFRNDAISVSDALKYDRIVLSPGPGVPKDAGIIPELLQNITTQKVLGICLGHQAIGEAFGGSIYNLDQVYHGVPGTCVQVSNDPIFSGLDQEFQIGRYHSWSVSNSLPSCLQLIGKEKDDQSVMAMKHVEKSIYGLQFHPESILTPEGKKIIQNWLNL